MRGVLAKGSRPTVICVSSRVFIGYHVFNSIKLTAIATLISGQ